MNWIKDYMREKQLQPDVQRMVTAHKELQWQRSKGMNEFQMFDDLPRSVHQEIKNYLYLDLVQKVPVFQDTDLNFQSIIAFKMRPFHVLSGWYIFRKGDEGLEMYFIKSGEVEICGDNGFVFVTLAQGAFFGEIALFEECKRTATARAKGNVELCTLKKEDFNSIMDSYPAVADRIRETIKARKDNEERLKLLKAAEERAKIEKEEEEARKKMFASSRRGLHLPGRYQYSSKQSSIRSRMQLSASIMSASIASSVVSQAEQDGERAPDADPLMRSSSILSKAGSSKLFGSLKGGPHDLTRDS
ncbi:hypothetical protein HK101_001143 [Irineochytrium annulatum]|nr:hypothetical protein HK101_001143 [Irineochytrium annulatum]